MTTTPSQPPASDDRPSLWQRWKRFFRHRTAETLRGNLEDVLETEGHDPAFLPQERVMLRNILKFREVRVSDVMIPRADIVAVADTMTLGELIQVFRTQNHSRVPVFRETLDEPLGMVHIRDFLDHLVSQAEEAQGKSRRKSALIDFRSLKLDGSLADTGIIRRVLYVPGSMPALDLLVKMQTTRTHMALVIDEYGGTEGLASIEDVVEVIVGDIEDEHDEETVDHITRTADGSYLMSARAHLEEVTEATGVDFSTDENAVDVDTLGGLLVSKVGRVPVKGEIIPLHALECEIVEADAKRIRKLRCTIKTQG